MTTELVGMHKEQAAIGGAADTDRVADEHFGTIIKCRVVHTHSE